MNDRLLIIIQVANAISIFRESVMDMHNELSITKVSAQVLPQHLTLYQMCNALGTSRENLT